MKHFIIFVDVIYNIGGSLIYAYNKLNYYRRKGYKVHLYHACEKGDSTLYIQQFKQYETTGYIPELRLQPFVFNKSQKRNVLTRMSKGINIYIDEVLIESDSYSLSLWAELLAAYTFGKHYCFPLGENLSIKKLEAYRFYKFKYDRGELFSIAPRSMQILFQGWMDLTLDQCRYLPAYCTNSVDDIDYLSSHPIEKGDYTIGCISRLDKEFVIHNLKKIRIFTDSHSLLRFTILLIGGTSNGNDQMEKQIREIFMDSVNANLIITGLLFPIPEELLYFADVYFASAGSCVLTQRIGMPTISCDANDLDAIGFYGITTENFLYRDFDEPLIDISILLEQVLIKREIHSKYKTFDLKAENEVDFSSHENNLALSSGCKEYFDFKNYKLNTVQIVKKMSVSVIGVKATETLWGMLHRFNKLLGG